MSAFDTLTKMYDLVSGSSDPILLKSVLEAQQDLIRLQEENRLLRQENNELKNKEITRSLLEHRGKAYYQNGEGPYCTTCFGVEGHLVRLTLEKIQYQDFLWGSCGNCKTEKIQTVEKSLEIEEEITKKIASTKRTSQMVKDFNSRSQF